MKENASKLLEQKVIEVEQKVEQEVEQEVSKDEDDNSSENKEKKTFKIDKSFLKDD